jgi:F420-dependent oxidoreductase-like protein
VPSLDDVYDIEQLRIFTEPQQGATYDDLRAVAQRAEQLGFGAFFRSDHYLAMGDALPTGGLPGPTDAWITLAGLARDTSSIRLGTLVSPIAFRSPGVLAISVATVDQMSGGRVELGLGAGWYEQEHAAYGIPFPNLGERFERLEEQLEIITGLWSTPIEETFNFAGEHYRLVDSPALPKPVQATIPVIIGGGGTRRTPQFAARFATEFNLPFRSLSEFEAQRARAIDACSAIDRDPSSLAFSAALEVVIGSNEREFQRRAVAIGRESETLRERGIAGVSEEAAATVQRWQDAGAERLYLQVLDLSDLDHLDLIAASVSSNNS